MGDRKGDGMQTSLIGNTHELSADCRAQGITVTALWMRKSSALKHWSHSSLLHSTKCRTHWIYTLYNLYISIDILYCNSNWTQLSIVFWALTLRIRSFVFRTENYILCEKWRKVEEEGRTQWKKVRAERKNYRQNYCQ